MHVLTPPSHAEQKAALQTRAAEDVLGDYKEYRAAALTDGSIDDKRKLVELQMRLIGAEADKKADPNANLPVFNFVFHSGGMQATMQVQPDAAPVEIIDADTQAWSPQDGATPTAQAHVVPFAVQPHVAPEVPKIVPAPTLDDLEALVDDLDALLSEGDF